jgi:heme/copper-type cytochrome/quinol oxidase subunit 1
MTTIDSSPDVAGDSALGRVLAADAAWLTSSDHKRIGRLFVSAGLLGLLATVVVNLLIAIERVDGASAAFDSDSWSQLVASQRVGLVFGTALPLVTGIALAIVPLQLGARALAFPRLAAAGLYMWFGGFVLSIVSVIDNGGFGGGNSDMVDLFLAAHALMALGITAAAVSLVSSILTTRAPGMTMRRVPFFSFSALVYGIGIVLVMPVFVGAIIYLFVDHRSGAREAFGGNEGITTWAGWIFTQPATFLFAIPVLGAFAELIPVTFRKRTPMRGIVFAGLALVGVSALAAVTQQLRFDVPWRGSQLYIGDGDDVSNKLGDVIPWALFHLLPLLGAGILFLMMLFLAKPTKDEAGDTVTPHITAGFLFTFFGFGMVLVGIAGSAIEPIVDLRLIDTVFGEANLVYVVYGIALGVMGAIAFWEPKLSGHALEMKKVAPLALLGVAGTILACFPLYIAGFLDQPVGLEYEDGDLQVWNVLVLIGHGLMALSVLAFLGLLASTVLGSDADAVDDPFDAQTIEWATTSPAPPSNFVDVPAITSAEPLLDLKSGADAADRNTANQDTGSSS